MKARMHIGSMVLGFWILEPMQIIRRIIKIIVNGRGILAPTGYGSVG